MHVSRWKALRVLLALWLVGAWNTPALLVAQVPNLEWQSGEAWGELSQREKMTYVSAVLVGCKYLALKYDFYEKPKAKVESYYQHLYSVSNSYIVSALDRIYQDRRYYQVPIIVLVFEFADYLKELR